MAVTEFDQADTDSTWIFVANGSELPINQMGKDVTSDLVENPSVSFQYQKMLQPNGELIVAQLIGSCRSGEGSVFIEKSLKDWRENCRLYERSILGMVF